MAEGWRGRNDFHISDHLNGMLGEAGKVKDVYAIGYIHG